MRNNHSNIDDLIQGIEVILSENRHSFTESQGMLLEEVVELLKETKRENLPKKHIDKAITLQALNLIARFFVEDFDHIKHILDEVKRLLGL